MILLINTPSNVYPPVSMSIVSFANMQVLNNEFKDVFDSMVQRVLTQHGISSKDPINLSEKKAQYGDLRGFEIEFQSSIHGTLSDVKIFLGQGNDKGPILLQANTLSGKISHITDHLDRTWGNIRYLD